MNPKPLEQLYSILDHEEETIVLELLDLTSPELVATYKHRVRQRHDYISKYYEGIPNEGEWEEAEVPYPREEREPRGLGSRSVWVEAGFDQDDENY